MKLYKLTDKDGMTMNNTQWGPGVTHTAFGPGTALCSTGWIHAYESPLLAVLLNPIHANFPLKSMRLWEAKGKIGLRDGQLKCGCKALTTLREIPLPQITTEQKVIFAVLCGKSVYSDVAWNAWADDWLSGEDRSAEAAEAAAGAAAAWAARAARAARVAEWAARAAAGAAEAWVAEWAARAAEWAAAGAAEAWVEWAATEEWAAEWVAAAAARAAEAWVARAAEAADLIQFAKQAVSQK